MKTLSWLGIAGFVLLSLSCEISPSQVTGIYAGNVAEASDTTVEIWLQLYSNGSFHQRETRYTSPLQTKVREGRWSVNHNLVILVINGEKDIRLQWEHGYLRNDAASMAHPDLPLDMVALQRIGQ